MGVCHGHGGDDGIARTSDVEHLAGIGALVHRLAVPVQGHAVRAIGHQDGLDAEAAAQHVDGGRVPGPSKHRIELGSVGLDQRGAAVALPVCALGVDQHRLAGQVRGLDDLLRPGQRALVVVRQHHDVRIADIALKPLEQKLKVALGR